MWAELWAGGIGAAATLLIGFVTWQVLRRAHARSRSQLAIRTVVLTEVSAMGPAQDRSVFWNVELSALVENPGNAPATIRFANLVLEPRLPMAPTALFPTATIAPGASEYLRLRAVLSSDEVRALDIAEAAILHVDVVGQPAIKRAVFTSAYKEESLMRAAEHDCGPLPETVRRFLAELPRAPPRKNLQPTMQNPQGVAEHVAIVGQRNRDQRKGRPRARSKPRVPLVPKKEAVKPRKRGQRSAPRQGSHH